MVAQLSWGQSITHLGRAVKNQLCLKEPAVDSLEQLAVQDKFGSLNGKVLLVTGGNRGIGKATASLLARRQLNGTQLAKVVITSRAENNGLKAAEDVRKSSANQHVCSQLIDLCDFSSVVAFADQFLKENDRLDILVCNAGTGNYGPGKITKDGQDAMIQANCLGHHLLIRLLQPLMQRSGSVADPSRIIILSSAAHHFPLSIDVDCLFPQSFPYTSSSIWYGVTKFFNALQAKGLAEEFGQHPSIVTYAVHPGMIKSDFYKSLSKALQWTSLCALWVLGLDENHGAATTVFVACKSVTEGESGKFWEKCQLTYSNPLLDYPGLTKRFMENQDEIIRPFLK